MVHRVPQTVGVATPVTDWSAFTKTPTMQALANQEAMLRHLGNILSELVELNQRTRDANVLLSSMFEMMPVATRPADPKHHKKKK
jgi:hypothetical protein